MSGHKLLSGRDLGQAICKHFGIDYHKHTVDSNFEIKTAPGELVSVKLTFMLRADDLAGIARMAGAEGWLVESVKWGTKEKEEIEPRDPYNGSLPSQPFERGPTVLLSDKVTETLRRYGARVERSEIAALTEEVRQLRKELNKSLYEVAKNTKRSVEIAEHSFDSLDAVTQVKVNPVGGGPSASCSGQEGPRTGHFIDGHGIKHTNLGGQG